jgi:predicted chitinase
MWEVEKKRIEKLRWWDEVAGKHGFPADIKVWHVHPLAWAENFGSLKVDLICKDCGATITLTEEFLKHTDVAPRASQAFIDELIKCSIELFPKYGVDTCRQIKHLLAQAKHETTDPIGGYPPFTAFRERLVYSSAERAYRLSTTAIDSGFARKGITFSSRQDKITWIQNNIVNNDRAYGEHLYGRNEVPEKDFRGRGLLHLTHYDTYVRCARAIEQPIDTQPELVESDPRVIIETGLWFWKDRNIAAIANNPANDGNEGVKKVTKPINTGLDGLANRQRFKREISVVFDQVFLANHTGCKG